MKTEKTKDFDSITQRVLYGFNFAFSDFVPVESKHADGKSTMKL